MAFNSPHSAGWSDGNAGNNSIDGSGDHTHSLSWAAIEESSLEKSSFSGSNYGRGAVARAEAPLSAPAQGPNTGDNFAFAGGGGFGLVQAGASPFRSLDPTGDFFSSTKKYQDVRTNFQPGAESLAPTVAEPKIGSATKVSPALLKVIDNLKNREVAAVSTASQTPQTDAALPETKFEIGLAVANDADVRQPGRVARAVVRLPEANEAPAAEVNQTPEAVVEAKPEVAAKPAVIEPEANPIDNPFKYVGDQHAEIKEKFDSNNVKYGRTTLLPDGRVVEVQTASDNTTLTNTKGELGANSMVVHDRYRRPVTEQHTDSDGSWSFSKLSYNDTNGIKPFCSEKLTVNSDGSVARMRYTSMGQIESKNHWSA